MGIETKQSRWSRVFASNSDWFTVLFTFVVIGQGNYFGLGLTILK